MFLLQVSFYFLSQFVKLILFVPKTTIIWLIEEAFSYMIICCLGQTYLQLFIK